jgi:hypothetical protein
VFRGWARRVRENGWDTLERWLSLLLLLDVVDVVVE